MVARQVQDYYNIVILGFLCYEVLYSSCQFLSFLNDPSQPLQHFYALEIIDILHGETKSNKNKRVAD